MTKRYGADMEGRVIHNQFLQIAADNGFPGLGIYTGIFLAVLWTNWQVRRVLKGRTDQEALQSLAVTGGVNCSLMLFCIGALFLSLEVFELPYLLMLLSGELGLLTPRTRPIEVGSEDAEGADDGDKVEEEAVVAVPY
jgi:hypothetical protein